MKEGTHTGGKTKHETINDEDKRMARKTLILSTRTDPHVQPVVATLSARFGDRGSKRIVHLPDGTQLSLEDIGSVWYRRPTLIQADAALPVLEQKFIEREARSGVWGLLRTLAGLWVNHPDAIREASYKPAQLATAQALGLEIPKTLITNQPRQEPRQKCAGLAPNPRGVETIGRLTTTHQ
jgi:hypothetical protein